MKGKNQKLSAGICDKCGNCKIHNEGNGYNEATIKLIYCGIDKTEIVPVPESHKHMRVLTCEDFKERGLTVEVCSSVKEIYLEMASINGVENIKEYSDIVQKLERFSIPVIATFFSREELHTDWYVCPICNYDDIQKKDNFCGCCGKPIKIKDGE